MLKNSLSALAVGSVLVFSLGLSATATANSAYMGVGATQWDFAVDEVPGDYKATAFTFRVGLDYNEYLAVETHATFGGSDSNTFQSYWGPVESEVELDMVLSAFAKGKLPITPQFRVFGLAGVSYVKATESISTMYGSESMSADDTNVAAGIGAEYDVTPSITISGDYIRHSLDKSEYDLDAISLVGSYRF
jgi:opacity protein-like surface antigen